MARRRSSYEASVPLETRLQQQMQIESSLSKGMMPTAARGRGSQEIVKIGSLESIPMEAMEALLEIEREDYCDIPIEIDTVPSLSHREASLESSDHDDHDADPAMKKEQTKIEASASKDMIPTVPRRVY